MGFDFFWLPLVEHREPAVSPTDARKSSSSFAWMAWYPGVLRVG